MPTSTEPPSHPAARHSKLTAAQQVAAPPRPRGEPHGVKVLDLDPDLGRWLEGDRRARAGAQLVGRVFVFAKGEWDVSSLHGDSPRSLGLLLAEGFVARELVMDGHVSLELFGPGDLLRPWDEDSSLVGMTARWIVLSPARMVVLGAAFTAQVRDFPEVSAELLARMHQRAQRLAETQAISQATKVEVRLHAMLWHLAHRWGRVSAEGTVVPLVLSHRMLAELVGARRPTVSVALAELERRGTVRRRDDGSWLLSGAPPIGRGSEQQRPVRARRRAFQAEPATSLAAARTRVA